MSLPSVQPAIEKKLISVFSPSHLQVNNESHLHSVPPGSETHFQVLIVSAQFTGLSRVARQRLVNQALAEFLNSGVHALTQRCLTPDEFTEVGADTFVSPTCHSKRS